ncbi:MAG: ParB/RepB/Spo0J family partition protein [Lachnospiraceae bacterium]|nr:ParB/RepB/Spo0J family partition protein [Lachnospiraceae bacterium]
MIKEQKYKLNSYNDLFGVSDCDEQPVKISLNELHDFKDHPYRVVDDEEMQELVNSIREQGILVPVIARPMKHGGYEVIAGHRRKYAAGLAGLERIPVVVRELSDSDAIDTMISTNIQRTNILPSEKAFAYRMQWEANSHRGKKGANTARMIAEQASYSTRQVQRFIRLSYLDRELLNFVDSGRMSIQAGHEISFLDEQAQSWVLDVAMATGKVPTGKMAENIRREYEEKKLTPEKLRIIMMGENRKPNRKITLKSKRINEYFPSDYSAGQIEEIVYSLLDRWRSEQNG